MREQSLIEEGYEGGFSCPNCGEYTETLHCDCGAIIDQMGGFIRNNTDNTYPFLDDRDAVNGRAKRIVERKKIEINGLSYDFYGEKMDGNILTFFLSLNGTHLKIRCNPFAKESILGISKKGRANKKWVSQSDFRVIKTIVSLFKNNPNQYGLENLKIFQH